MNFRVVKNKEQILCAYSFYAEIYKFVPQWHISFKSILSQVYQPISVNTNQFYSILFYPILFYSIYTVIE